MFRLLALIASLAPLTPSAHAEDAQAVAAVLKQGGYVIVFRHGATTAAKNADPMGAGRGKSTSTERQLSPRGRQSARVIGEAFQTMHIPVGEVYTSKLSRAIDTGRLISGKEVTTALDLSESGDGLEPVEHDRRAEAMRKIAATSPAKGTNTIVVSHKPNIVDAFGKDWSDVGEGEASIFHPDGYGRFAFVARVQASEWAELAKSR